MNFITAYLFIQAEDHAKMNTRVTINASRRCDSLRVVLTT